QDDPASLNRECVGYYSINCASIQPEFSFTQRTTLSFDEVDLSLRWRFIDAVEVEPLVADTFLEEFRTIPSEHYFDLTAVFNVTDSFALTAAVINLFDNEPKVVGSNIGSTSYNSGNVFPSTYDALGRRYSVTARMTF
ncbi:MAG: TonB-dependent receptor, partial [Erythrobacter sp.]